MNPYDVCYITYQVNTDTYNPVMFVVSRFGGKNSVVTKISDTNPSNLTSGKFINFSVNKYIIKFSFTSNGILSFTRIKTQ